MAVTSCRPVSAHSPPLQGLPDQAHPLGPPDPLEVSGLPAHHWSDVPPYPAPTLTHSHHTGRKRWVAGLLGFILESCPVWTQC